MDFAVPEPLSPHPDIQRVYLTEVQYYRNPNYVPVYGPDDFIKQSNSVRYKFNEEEKKPSEIFQESLQNELLPEGESSPLPPKRRNAGSQTELWQKLKEAGVVVSNEIDYEEKRNFVHSYKKGETSGNINHINSNASNSTSGVQAEVQIPSFNSLPTTKTFENRLYTFEEKDKVDDSITKNLDKFEINVGKLSAWTEGSFNVSMTENNLKKSNSVNNSLENLVILPDDKLKSLSMQDLMEFEADIKVKHVSFDNAMRTKNPPPRPALPKRFSCPPMVAADTQSKQSDDKDIFFGDGLFQKTEERNEEAEAFCTSIANLRAFYPSSQLSTNPGFVSPAVVKNNALLKTNINITVYLEPISLPMTIKCELSKTADEVIAKCLAGYQANITDLDLMADQYVLKVIGYSMYLYGDVRLCDYVHIQECMKRNQAVRLSLVRRSRMNVEFARDINDDEEDCRGIYFRHFFEIPISLSVSEHGLYVLLNAYNSEAAKLIESVSRTYEAQYVPEQLIQVVKAICNSLAYIELSSIQDAVNILLYLKGSKKMQRSYTVGTKERYNPFINPMHFNKSRFHQALQKLTTGVYSLIQLYCKAFHADFTIDEAVSESKDKPEDVYERIDPGSITDNFVVRLASVHRMPSKWKHNFESFEMEIGLYFGGILLCPLQRSAKVKSCMGFYEHIKFSELLEFDIPVKKLPRETKISFILRGNGIPKKGTDGKTVLGWACLNIYDFQGFLLSGSKLFGLLSDVDFNPVATCATNYIQRSETVIVKVDYQIYHTEVLFPEPVLLLASFTPYMKYSSSQIEFVNSIMRKDTTDLSKRDKNEIWKHRYALIDNPQALVYTLVSVPNWDSETVSEVHSIISCWKRLEPQDALQLLHADFPDKTVRETAVQWLSDISNDDLCDYLLELVQALKYETYHNSALARFLIKRALVKPRVAHFLFWHLKYYTGDLQFCQRFQIVLSGLLSVCGDHLRDQLSRQDALMVSLQEVARKVKDAKDAVRKVILQVELEKLVGQQKMNSCVRLPLDPALKVSNILPGESSYFSSYTVPLKVAFCNADPRGEPFHAIFKLGDDLRKDLVTLLMFRAMNKLWLSEGLDLKMMLYNVLPTGHLAGLIEIIPNASTFREIHVQHGLTGSFKDNSLALWLQRFNSTEDEYRKSVDNFTASAAGYCVATYLLGIGDRHNDNIMLTRNGYLFHIDFSKFMGDVQKFGSISRDRVPFVLTPDMAYVINNGFTTTPNFQRFIECCCNGFNIIRRNMNLVLNLLGLMVYSGISYLSRKEDVMYVRKALQLHLTDDEATMFFTRLIESSLSSRATQLNFFIHNIAHMKNVSENLLNSSRSSPLFSFSNKVHTMDEDGQVESARVVDFQKRYLPEKHYIFILNILRTEQSKPHFIFRRYENFQEFHAKLMFLFSAYTNIVLPDLPPRILMGRSQIRNVAVHRRVELDKYMHDLSKLPLVWQSDVVYTFLHSYIKDIEEERKFSDFVEQLQEGRKSRIGGKIKLSMEYRRNALHILVMHVSKLVPRRIQGLAEPYVKMYLLPDPIKYTKRKTKICRKTLNPTYNETLVFDVALELIQRRILQVTVWDHDSLSENDFLGGINFYLSTFNLTKPKTGWFDLTDIFLS